MDFTSAISFDQNSWKIIDLEKKHFKKPTIFKFPITVKRPHTVSFLTQNSQQSGS